MLHTQAEQSLAITEPKEEPVAAAAETTDTTQVYYALFLFPCLLEHLVICLHGLFHKKIKFEINACLIISCAAVLR